MTPLLTYKDGIFTLTGATGLTDTETWGQDRKGCTTVDFKAAAEWLRYADKRARKILDRAFVKHYPAPSRPLPLYLDPHQLDGVSWVLTRSRSYLAHAPGAGKTCEAVTAALYTPGPGAAVFIVPPSLTANWAREIERWAWDARHTGAGRAWPALYAVGDSASQKRAGWRAEFVIVPDSMLTKPWVLERLLNLDIRFLAVDEASRFKERKADRTKALFGGKLKSGRESPGLVYKPRHAVLLDGSPMPNRPMELWAPTYAMSPESIDFRDEQDFGFRYCGATMNKFGRWEFKHDSNLPELKEKLRASFMHVVTESELNHPERRRSILVMTKDARSPAHKKWERLAPHALSLKISEDASQGDLARFRAELGLRKVPWVADYIADRLTHKPNEPILLFCWHREVAFELERRLKKFKPALVIGGTDAHEREKSFLNFQAGITPLIIGNIGAMGRGHNLQSAKRVVFAEYSWTDELNKQCEKRASRRGNEDIYTRCEYIVSPGSMDETILNAVFRKADRVKRLIG